MKKIPRDPERWEVLQCLADRCEMDGRSINHPAALPELLDVMMTKVAEVLGDPKRVPGIAHESVFENVVIELGAAELIKREDAGGVAATVPVQPPDFRIALPGGRQLLVEVKTVQSGPRAGMRIPAKEVLRLSEYSRLTGGELWFATFWEGLGWWTLTRPADFREKGTYRILSMSEALKRNAMRELGDVLVATVPPITVRLVADTTKPRQIDGDGVGRFTIARVELACNGRPILDREGRSLAYFIFLFGSWDLIGPHAGLSENDGAIVYVDWRAEPEDAVENQGMRVVGPLSSMYTRLFKALTTDDAGQFVRLRVAPRAGRLRRLAPSDFPFGQSGLRLWILELEPNRTGE